MSKKITLKLLAECMKAYRRNYITFACRTVLKTADRRTVSITSIDLKASPVWIRVFHENEKGGKVFENLEEFSRRSRRRIAGLILANLKHEHRMTVQKMKDIYLESGETMAYLLDTYEGCRSLKWDEIQELLTWSGDDDIVTAEEIMNGWGLG